MRISHRVTTSADPEQVWTLLADPARWPEFELFLRRVEGSLGAVREGQHLMATARGLPLRVPVDVRLVARARQLGLTVHSLPGLRQQVDHSVGRRARGGSEVRTSVVLEGPIAPFAVLPVWVSAGVTTRLIGFRAGRAHRRARAGERTGAA